MSTPKPYDLTSNPCQLQTVGDLARALQHLDQNALLFASLPGDSITDPAGYQPILVQAVQELPVLQFGPLNSQGNIQPEYETKAVNLLLTKNFSLLTRGNGVQKAPKDI